jgi:hypothetical protein
MTGKEGMKETACEGANVVPQREEVPAWRWLLERP